MFEKLSVEFEPLASRITTPVCWGPLPTIRTSLTITKLAGLVMSLSVMPTREPVIWRWSTTDPLRSVIAGAAPEAITG